MGSGEMVSEFPDQEQRAAVCHSYWRRDKMTTDMNFSDRAVIAGTKIRESDGALLADARIARTGVQLYLGSEVDPDNDHGFRDRRVVRIYRPGDEIFSDETMASAAHRPVTNDHPAEKRVDADNWKRHAVGQTADEVTGEGIYIRVPLMVSDGDAIRDIQRGKRELSAGYTSTLDWTAGTTPDGEEYDAIQRNIRINHVAIVGRGRAGHSVRIGDEATWGAAPIEDGGENEGDHTMATNMKSVTVDGITVEVTDQGAQVIEKLQQQLAKASESSAKVLQDHATALAEKDKQLASKDAEIDGLKKKVLSDADIDKLVVERAALVDSARKIAPDLKIDGLDAAGIKKAAVAAKLGEASVTDKTSAYIDARFDILLEDVDKVSQTDAFRQASQTRQTTTDTSPARSAYDKMLADMQTASLPATAKAN